jgi:hypothetical protein
VSSSGSVLTSVLGTVADGDDIISLAQPNDNAITTRQSYRIAIGGGGTDTITMNGNTITNIITGDYATFTPLSLSNDLWTIASINTFDSSVVTNAALYNDNLHAMTNDNSRSVIIGGYGNDNILVYYESVGNSTTGDAYICGDECSCKSSLHVGQTERPFVS